MARKLAALNFDVTLPTGKRKLSEWDFYSDRNVRWHRHERIRLNGMAGSLYFCDSVPDYVSGDNYSNVVILKSRSQYAPEQVSSVVFVADKAMR